MDLTLAEQVLLLSFDDTTGKPVIPSNYLDYAVSGAQLLELSFAGRLAVDHGHLRVISSTPVGDPVLDRMLVRVKAEIKSHPTDWWVYHFASHERRDHVLDQLVDRGLLSRSRHLVLGVIPGRVRYPEVDLVPEQEIVARLNGVLDGDAVPDQDSMGLLAITHACSLDRHLFPDRAPEALRHRIAELTEREWCGPAVSKVIGAMNVAVMAAISGGIASNSTAAVATR